MVLVSFCSIPGARRVTQVAIHSASAQALEYCECLTTEPRQHPDQECGKRSFNGMYHGLTRLALVRDLRPARMHCWWWRIRRHFICGERDAIRGTLSRRSIAGLCWIGSSREATNLTAFTSTHGHGVFLGWHRYERFRAKGLVATPEVVFKAMHEASVTDRIENFWRRLFTATKVGSLVGGVAARGRRRVELEGHKIVAVNAGADRTAPPPACTPVIGRIVLGGEAVYNGIFIPTSAETDTQRPVAWFPTLDKLEARIENRGRRAKGPENDDDPRILGRNAQYLRDFDALNEATAKARELMT